MKKVLLIILIVVILGLGWYFLVNLNDDVDVEEKCVDILGGSYNLIFETNHGKELESISVCIACSPGSYPELPTTTREGYDFDGWYYDKELKNPVDATNVVEINPVPKKKGKCTVGYKDITLYAAWKITGDVHVNLPKK